MHRVKEAENSTSNDDNQVVVAAVYLLPCLMLQIGYLLVVDDYTLSQHRSPLVEPNQYSDYDSWQLHTIGSCCIHPVAENGPHLEWEFELSDEVGHAQDTCFRHFVGILVGSIHDLDYALYFV